MQSLLSEQVDLNTPPNTVMVIWKAVFAANHTTDADKQCRKMHNWIQINKTKTHNI